MIFQLKGLEPSNKGHTNFYECCGLTKKYICCTYYCSTISEVKIPNISNVTCYTQGSSILLQTTHKTKNECLLFMYIVQNLYRKKLYLYCQTGLNSIFFYISKIQVHFIILVPLSPDEGKQLWETSAEKC